MEKCNEVGRFLPHRGSARAARLAVLSALPTELLRPQGVGGLTVASFIHLYLMVGVLYIYKYDDTKLSFLYCIVLTEKLRLIFSTF